ncbi:Long-chain-fatty-acid--CoA ligase [compost metagenome]
MTDKWLTTGQITIPRLLHEAAEKWPDKVYLDFSGNKYTFAEVEREATRIAHGLSVIGIAPGDRVCSMLDNNPDNIFVWFAVNMLGGVIVPINTDMRGEFLRRQVEDADATIMVVEDGYAERVFMVEGELPCLKTLIVRGELPRVASHRKVIGLDSVRADNTTLIHSHAKPSDLAILMYTSGTTGPSKGCMISHNQACNFGRRVVADHKLTIEDTYWTPLPLFHVGASCAVGLSTLQVGATAAIYPRFSASNFWPEIERSGANKVLMLSIMLSIIAEAPDSEESQRCYGKLEAVLGMPFPGALQAKWKERFGVRYAMCPGYGSSEVYPIVSMPIDTENVPEGAVGRLHDDLDVRIFNDDGEECPPGVAGEVVLRPRKPDIMFQGYWRRPDATAEAMRNLWFHTGDMAKFDENGFLFFVDRKKDSLRKGGENISSFEVEAVFLRHPNVQEVVAHAVKSELAEDELKVTIVLKPDSVLSEEELCLWSVERLPRFAVPRYIEFRETLPRTSTGKAQKYLLRDEGVTPRTWDRISSSILIPKK